MTTHKPRHAESRLHRKLVLFGAALEQRLQHFPSCHKYALTQELRRGFVEVYSLDHLCKRDLRLQHYGRYMDDSIMVVEGRAHGETVLQAIAEHLHGLRLAEALSRLGHARKTHSFAHMMAYARDTNHDLHRRLPQALHRAHRHHAQPAG